MIKWQQDFDVNRVWATFGNASTFGAYLSLTLPLLITGIVIHKKPWPKIIFIASTGVGFIAIIFTDSRGAWLGLVLGIVLLIIRFWTKIPSRLRTPSYLILIFVFLFSVFSFEATKIEKERGTAAGRIILWADTLDLIKDKPILGHGLETFQYVFPEFISEEYEEKVTRKTIIDNAHNFFLQCAANNGVPLTALLIALFAFISFRLWKTSSDDHEEYVIISGSLAGLTGYLIALQFHLSTVATSPIFWVLLGISATYLGKDHEPTLQIKSQNTRFWLAPVILIILGFWIVGTYMTSRFVLADMAFRQGLAMANIGDHQIAQLHFYRAEYLHPYEEYYPLTSGQILLDSFTNDPEKESLYASSRSQFLIAKNLNPVDEYVLLGLADLEFVHGKKNGSTKEITSARQLYLRILEHDPNFNDVKAKISEADKLLTSLDER